MFYSAIRTPSSITLTLIISLTLFTSLESVFIRPLSFVDQFSWFKDQNNWFSGYANNLNGDGDHFLRTQNQNQFQVQAQDEVEEKNPYEMVDNMRQQPIKVGGYTDDQSENPSEMEKKIEELRQKDFFVESEAYARKYYSDLNNGQKLGKLISVESQVVSGVNYKMLFETENKEKNAEIVVWAQPWTDTYEILNPIEYKKSENVEIENNDESAGNSENSNVNTNINSEDDENAGNSEKSDSNTNINNPYGNLYKVSSSSKNEPEMINYQPQPQLQQYGNWLNRFPYLSYFTPGGPFLKI